MSANTNFRQTILIKNATDRQLAMMQQWLNDEYQIVTSPDAPNQLTITYSNSHTTGNAVPVITFESTSSADGNSSIKTYSLPESQGSHTVIRIITGLLLAYKKESFNHKNYQTAFERSHDIILLSDCAHNIIKANKTAVDILGYTEEELYTMNLEQLFYSEEAGKDFIENICIENKIVHWEYRLKSKQGRIIDVMMSADMMDKEDNIFLCIAQDITIQKEEYKKRKQEEHLVIMGKMAQIIAHEVRNPLNNILLAITQLKSDEELSHEEEKLFLDIIDRNCLRINELITDMLDPTRIMDIELSPQSLNHLIREAIYLAEDRLILRDIYLRDELKEDYTLLMDKDKMLIGISNILINAIEAIDHKNGQISIATEQDEQYVTISIEDNGKGMTEAEQSNMFNPYFTTKTNGTGMGMAATQQIIRAHKGMIRVSSVKGTGTRITIAIPVVPAKEA